jgi:putative hydrolase of the HAD superfamily
MRSLRAADLHATFGGPALTPDGLQEWVADFRRELDAAWTATAEASDAVDELLRLGYRLGAVTNARRDEQQAKLDRLGLADRVPLLACLDDLGRGKPDPRIWHLACERFGVPPARSAYVGDELDVDARGAVAAGLLGVWLDRHATGERPGDVAVITDLRQLPAVLGPGPAPAPGPGPDPI